MKPCSPSLALAVILCPIAQTADLRIGLIGLDTSHVTAFTEVLNNPNHKDHVPGGRVTAAFRGGSLDVESSRTRLDGFTQELTRRYGIRLYDSIDELCRHVDAVMLESVDGRPHLAQAIPVILAGKPLFIDKPMAASLGDVLAIFRLAEEHHVPVFSASSLRYGHNTQAVRHGTLGTIQRADTTSPCPQEPHHPTLFWYGIHGVESLFTVMGTGCESVRCPPHESAAPEVIGTWTGDRTGTFRAGDQYGGQAHGQHGTSEVGQYEGYAPLLIEVMRFFQTGVPPVDPEETIELFAFMEAADESLRRGGEPVRISEILKRYGYRKPPHAQLLETRMIWDAAPHNAFTDLIRLQETWLCTFREGSDHVSPDGAIRVITSKDGVQWESAAHLAFPGADLRDPKIIPTPDDRVMIVAAAALHQPAPQHHQTYAWFSDDGRTWGEPTAVGEPDIWLWRVQWHQNMAYSVGYHTVDPRFTRLYRSSDGGHTFTQLTPQFFDRGYPNEAALLFTPDASAVCLLRRDGSPATAQIGWAPPPYSQWTWKDLNLRLGGPCLLALPNGEVLAGGRLYDGSVRTALGWLDTRWGRFKELLTLPSGGDTSYPGLVWWEGQVWMSYYASHEGKTSIYLARVAVTPPPA